MKRVIGGILALLLLVPFGIIDTAQGVDDGGTALRVIRALEIIEGNEVGDLMLQKQVTRAEFVKMVLTASVYKDTASSTASVSPFPDVRSTHWAAGYIKTAVDLNVINGYLDGTFRPNATVKLEEAVQILLKMLGYTPADLSGAFPEAQMAFYHSLHLDEDMVAKQGETLDRIQCVQLLYNFLSTPTKEGTVYCQTMGYETDASGEINYTQVLSQSMEGPIVVKDHLWAMQLPFDSSQAESYTAIDVGQVQKNDIVYYSHSLKAVWIYREKKTGIYTAAVPSESTPTSILLDGQTYALGNADVAYEVSLFGSFHTGDLVTLLLGKENLVEGVVSADLTDPDVEISDLINQTIEGPLIAEGDWAKTLDFSPEEGKIYEKGATIEVSQIEPYDVLYYSNPFKMIWVFHNRASGILESVGPVPSAPQTVTVSGKTYSIETSDAAYALSSLGTFRAGDTVTLLLGRDGGVVAVIPPGETESVTYGIVTSQEKTSYPDGEGGVNTAKTITMIGTDGEHYTYPIKEQQEYQVGDLIQVLVKSEGISVSMLTRKSLSGTVNSNGTAIGEILFADDVEILDEENAVAVRVYPWRLRGVALKEDDVQYYALNEAGEISCLILEKVTGDMHQYGIVTDVQEWSIGTTAQGVYAYEIDGVAGSLVTQNTIFSISTGPAQFMIEGNRITKIRALSPVPLETFGDFSAQGEDGTLYKLSQEVAVYVKRDNTYYYTNQKALENSEAVYKLTGFYDRKDVFGGCIRVIIAQ